MNKQIYAEAAEWLVELRVADLDGAARERLDAWFRASPQHIQAFLELSSIWEDGGDPDLAKNSSAALLIARARAASNVVAMERTGEKVVPTVDTGLLSRRSRNRGWLYGLATGALGCALALGIFVFTQHGMYTTGTGEERTISLEDGSVLELNSRSRVRVRYSGQERDVELLDGQALFRVAKDAARPFIVRSDSTRVRAVGTQFDVYRQSTGTTVTVVEGRVGIYSQPPSAGGIGSGNTEHSVVATTAAAPVILVSAGEQVTATASAISAPKHIDTAAETAWTKRELVFDSTPLYEVTREFNRYNGKKLIVSDQALRDFHVTGVFSSTDPASLLRFLRAQPGIDVVEVDGEIRICGK